MAHFTASPPRITDGIATLATKLLDAAKILIPADVRDTDDFAEFESEWEDNFARLPTLVQSIREDIQAYKDQGAMDKLVRALNTILVETGAVVIKLLPEELGDQLAKYLGAVGDALGGIGDAVEAFEQGDTPAAVEAIYTGLQAATRDLVPAHLQNDDTYRAVTAVLDSTLGNLSRHVLEYKQQLEQSSVCWKGFASRERQRPHVCEDGYTWDQEQWCLPEHAASYTIQSVRSGKYLNVETPWLAWGNGDGNNVHVWDNPNSEHSQWKIQRAADGSFIIKNVRWGTYLHIGGDQKKGDNVEMSRNAASVRSEWKLRPTDRHAVFTIESTSASGKYVNLQDGGTSKGTNVRVWDTPGDEGSQWRVVSTSGEEAFQAGPSLLETSLASKRPSDAMPAACDQASDFPEKRGSWCQAPCSAGYESTGARCKALCGASYPSDSDRMCGENPGVLAAAQARIATEFIRQLFTIGSLVSSIRDGGSEVAAGLTGTMQSLIDLGKVFAHPECPV